MTEIKIVDAFDEVPLCPHCGKELSNILKVKHGAYETHTVYFCPHCKKVISVGNNVGWK